MSGQDGETPQTENVVNHEDKKEENKDSDQQFDHGNGAGGGGPDDHGRQCDGQGAGDVGGNDNDGSGDPGYDAYALFHNVPPDMATDHNFMASLLGIMADYHKRKAAQCVKTEPAVPVSAPASTKPLFSATSAASVFTCSPTTAVATTTTNVTVSSSPFVPVTNSSTTVPPSTAPTFVHLKSVPSSNAIHPPTSTTVVSATHNFQNPHISPFTSATAFHAAPMFNSQQMHQSRHSMPIMSTVAQPIAMTPNNLPMFHHHQPTLTGIPHDQLTWSTSKKFSEILKIVGPYNSRMIPLHWLTRLESKTFAYGLTIQDLVDHVKMFLENSKDAEVKDWYDTYLDCLHFHQFNNMDPQWTWDALKHSLCQKFNPEVALEEATERLIKYQYTNESAAQYVKKVTTLVRKVNPAASDEQIIHNLYTHLTVELRGRMQAGGKHSSIQEFETSLRIVLDALKVESQKKSETSSVSTISCLHTTPVPAVKVLNHGVCHFCAKGPHKAEECWSFNAVALALMKEDRFLTFDGIYRALIKKEEYTSEAIKNYFANPTLYLPAPRQSNNYHQQRGGFNGRGGRGGQRRGFYRRGGNNNNGGAARQETAQGAANNNNNGAEN